MKLQLDRIPSCQNLLKRKVIAISENLGCSVCWEVLELVNRTFVACVSQHVCGTRFVGRWLGWEWVLTGNLLGVLRVFVSLSSQRRSRLVFILFWQTTLWFVWKAKNYCIFSGRLVYVEHLVKRIQYHSKKWLFAKYPRHHCSLYERKMEPIMCWSSRVLCVTKMDLICALSLGGGKAYEVTLLCGVLLVLLSLWY